LEQHEGLSVPFESSHKFSLKLSNEESISIYVPWPFLIDKFSTEPSQHENLIKLNLTKTINDPWPMNFGGRSKWDIDRLKLWVSIETVFQDNIMAHLASQFNITEEETIYATSK